LIETNNRPPGVAATVGFNIPLPWGREASEQQAATAQLGATQQHYEAALLDIQSALAEAREKLKAAQRKGAATSVLRLRRSIGSTISNSSGSRSSWTKWISRYNEEACKGRRCFGKTPMQTIVDAIPIVREKMLASREITKRK
jgi:hypothetical protein